MKEREERNSVRRREEKESRREGEKGGGEKEKGGRKRVNKKQKAEARETERWCKVDLKLANRENCSSRRRSVVEDGLQEAEINSIECAACFGLYEDDGADGQLT